MKRIASLLAGAAIAVCPVLAQESPVAKQPQAKSQKEMEAVMAIFNSADSKGRIKAANDLLTNFADTEFKAVALQVAAMSFQELNDFENMVIYCERTLEADPKSFQAMLLLAGGLAQKTREHDLDKEEKLGKAEKYARQAIEVLKVAPRPRPDIPEDQWAMAKKDFSSQAYDALGLSAMARKKYDDAITNFKASLETSATPEPATKVRLAASYNFAGKYDEAITVLDALMADPALNPTIMQFARSEKAKAVEGKAGKK